LELAERRGVEPAAQEDRANALTDRTGGARKARSQAFEPGTLRRRFSLGTRRRIARGDVRHGWRRLRRGRLRVLGGHRFARGSLPVAAEEAREHAALAAVAHACDLPFGGACVNGRTASCGSGEKPGTVMP